MIRFVRRYRTRLFLVALLLAGGLIGQFVAERQQSGPPLSSRDAGPGGALGLALWLHELGYGVARLEDSQSPPLETAHGLFVLQPVRRFDEAEAGAILNWVERGGVLVYVPSLVAFGGVVPTIGDDGLDLALGLSYGSRVEEVTASSAFFSEPRASRFAIRSERELALRDDAWYPLVDDGGRTFVATRAFGKGRVYVSTSERFFSNGGLREADNYALALNVLARHPQVRDLAFEESHHGVFQAPDLLGEMRSSPWGWAVAYAALATFGFLLWGGRRFGPAVVRAPMMARSSGEYVAAFGGLLQAARAIQWTQTEYRRLVRRRLGRMLGVRSDLPSGDLARLVAERLPIDGDSLADDLASLDRSSLTERGLMARVRAIEEMLAVPHQGGK